MKKDMIVGGIVYFTFVCDHPYLAVLVSLYILLHVFISFARARGCYSAQEVLCLCMGHQHKRRETTDALLEIMTDVSSDEFASLSDQELIKMAQDLTM